MTHNINFVFVRWEKLTNTEKLFVLKSEGEKRKQKEFQGGFFKIKNLYIKENDERFETIY